MNGLELRRIRRKLNLTKDEFALQLGYRGSTRNNYHLMARYEHNMKQIPLTVLSLAWLIEKYFDITGTLPVWPEWPGYEDPIGPPVNYDDPRTKGDAPP